MFALKKHLTWLVFGLTVLVSAHALAANERDRLVFGGSAHYPPFSYLEQGEPKGMVVDMVRAAEKRLGQPIEIRLLEWKEAQKQLLEDQIDFIGPMAVAEARLKIFDFTGMVVDLQTSIFLRAGGVGVTRLSDLHGQRVGVTAGGLAALTVEAEEKVQMVPLPDDVKANLQMLREGRLDALVADRWVSNFILAEQHLNGIREVGEAVASRPASFAVRKGNSAVLVQLDATIAALQADGTLNRIYEKWSPKEVVLRTREQVARDAYLLVIGFLIFLLVAGTVWVLMARRELARRRATEARLVESEARQRALMYAIPDLVWLKDAQGVFLSCNHRFECYFGVPEKDIVGKTDYDFVSREAADLYRKYDLAAMAKGEASVNEEWVTFACDGHRELLETTKVPIFDAPGHLIGVLGIGHDITERQQVEQDLHAYQDQLENKVEERTRSLDETVRRLGLALEAAESANRAKSVFLSNMSHELRTPLNAVLGFSHLMQRDKTMSASSHKKLETINRSGQHLLSLINDVLELSRIEAGRIIIQRQPFDLKDLLSRIEEMMRVRAEGKELDFLVEHDDDLPVIVEGDATHLKQVLINLLGNAVKYTEHGRVSLRVSRCHGDICFAVSDSGPGIAVEDQERIFKAFYQTESGQAKGDGTGLGLTISREYARMMEGQLEVDSRPGQGSLFSLRLPLPEVMGWASKPPAARILGLEAGQEGLRVLVVDDNADNRELVQQLLEATGFEVSTADNGQQAVDSFLSGPPDLIWMDMRMPVLDGYEATRQIRCLPGGDKVKIVALTASAFEDNREDILAAGCDEMVSKPLEEERLFAVMGELLGLRYRQDESSTSEPKKRVLDLGVLPSEMLQKLVISAEALDLESVRQLVLELQTGYPDQAATLDGLVQEFRFDRIAELGRAAEGSTATHSASAAGE